MIDDSVFILINVYNANTESKQIQTSNELNTLLSNLDLSREKYIVFGREFNFFFDHTIDAKSCSPSLKKQSLFRLIQIKLFFFLFNISTNLKKVPADGNLKIH